MDEIVQCTLYCGALLYYGFDEQCDIEAVGPNTNKFGAHIKCFPSHHNNILVIPI